MRRNQFGMKLEIIDDGSLDDRIVRSIRHIMPNCEFYIVLQDTPEQFSDIYRVLVDGKAVVGFELMRQGDGRPTNMVICSVEDYRRRQRGLAMKKFIVAIELARAAQKRDTRD